MKSKVINMADRTSDAEDRLLESLFHAEPIADNGFSKQVVSRIRRTIWIRRLALPVAAAVGAVFALRPALELGGAALELLQWLPVEIRFEPAQYLAQFQLLALPCLALATAIALVRFVEET